MIRHLILSPKTYFRVWIFQLIPKEPKDDQNWCANYQLFMTVSPSIEDTKLQRKINQKHRCTSEELPSSLNSERYLQGLDGNQKNFHYRQSYRVDNLWHNKGHIINFRLKEPTLVRILAPLHRHLEFELILAKEKGVTHTVLHRAKREDHHTTIFAQLAPGSYSLRVAFFSDAQLLQIPCQVIQLEMAMSTIKQSKQQMETIRKRESLANVPNSLTLTELFESHNQTFKPFFKQNEITLKDIKNIQGGLKSEEEAEQMNERELLVEVMRSKFEIAEDDDAGIMIDIRNDFLLSGINIGIRNLINGQLVEHQRHESSSQILVEKLMPGNYEFLIYTHKCLTNLDQNESMPSFDVLFEIKVKLIRHFKGQFDNVSSVKGIQINSRNWQENEKQTLPMILTSEEIRCLKEFSHLPDQLNFYGVNSQIELTDTFFLPTHAFQEHEIHFKTHEDQDSLRVFLGKSNSKISILKEGDRSMIAQSRSIEEGRAQLLITTNLISNTDYLILLEFTERAVALNGQLIGGGCENFDLAIKTQSLKDICISSDSSFISWDEESVNQNGEPKSKIVPMAKKTQKKKLQIEGLGEVDLKVTIDYSSSFYMPDFEMHAQELDHTGNHEEAFWHKQGNVNKKELAIIAAISHSTSPMFVDYSRKFSVTFFYAKIRAGKYRLQINQRFRSSKSPCVSPVTITITAWKSGESQIWVDSFKFSHLNLFQSEREEQEKPRIASRLPLDLKTYKFLGGEPKGDNLAEELIFSGPIQFDELEEKNVILFKINKNDTIVRFYVERLSTILTLDKLNGTQSTMLTSSISALYWRLEGGDYRLKLGQSTFQAKENAALIPPRAQITILVADQRLESEHNKTWSNLLDDEACTDHSNFPLALRQQRQSDTSQLVYDYPFIKVDKKQLSQMQVLQTYNFRINVTSRIYFEVGMHLLSQQVVLQLISLGEKTYSISGKQRGNLNILDIEVGAGDYGIDIKQPYILEEKMNKEACGLFSMQGIVSSIGLMSTGQNNGDIIQKGLNPACSKITAFEDQLPLKIYGSKEQTKGGGEPHVDQKGHFIKHYQNVLFRTNDRAELIPEYDRIEITVIEDSWMHLTFSYEEQGLNVIKLMVVDTSMGNQPIPVQSYFKIMGLFGGMDEFISEYKLLKGHHYILNIYYEGGSAKDKEGRDICQIYDLIMSISHIAQMIVDTSCSNIDKTQSFIKGLPQQIKDNNLDKFGNYVFKETLKLKDPEDFQLAKIFASGQVVTPEKTFAQIVTIQLGNNFDLTASIEFQYDQAMYTMSLIEFGKDEDGDHMTGEISNEQYPIFFKNNNDRFTSVKRKLRAINVESKSKKKKYALVITNMQPDIIPRLRQSQIHVLDGCLYITLKIKIHSSKRSDSKLFVKQASTSTAPVLTHIKPSRSPTFISGRPQELTFDLIFNKQPYLKNTKYPKIQKQSKEEITNSLKQAIKIQIMMVNLIDGTKQNIVQSVSNLYQNSKEYLPDEYHVNCIFDISKYSGSQKYKLVQAQLFIEIDQLIDSQNNQFTIKDKFKKRGMPIYVLQDSDTTQIMAEEDKEVREALESSLLGQEIHKQESQDILTDQGQLEKEIFKIKQEQQKQLYKTNPSPIKCLCVHGICRPGESTCSGPCLRDWSGINCDTPSQENLKKLVVDASKDFTRDGLYQPKQISDERRTGGELANQDKAQSTQILDTGNLKQNLKKLAIYILSFLAIYVVYRNRHQFPCWKQKQEQPISNNDSDEEEENQPTFELSGVNGVYKKLKMEDDEN